MRLIPVLAATSAITAAALLVAAAPRATRRPDPAAAALAAIRPAAIEAHMRFLADDLLEGRGTGTRGYDLAAHYVANQFRAIGLEPAGERGTFFQTVPFLVARNVPAKSAFVLERGGASRILRVDHDLAIGADYLRDRVEVRAPLVFAGYGVVAPELDYDDYAGLDVRGKIVVALRGAPPRFPNDQRAWHAWGRLKEQRAAERGAVGFFSLSTPRQLERSPWARSLRQSRMPGMRWLDARGHPHAERREIQASGTLGPDAAARVFEGAKVPLAEVFALADSSRPPRFDLPWTARVRVQSQRWNAWSPNVAALLPGSDPRLRDEVVVLTGHLDHLGIGPPVNGDSIYNGACDNASGIAAMIEVARALRAMPRAPRRSILFLPVTGEEKGLQGSEYFTEHPTVRHRIVANVNLDMYTMLDPLREIVAFGAEHSTLEANVARAAKRLGLAVAPDPRPEEVVFIRSDQFPFVRKGIPAVFADGGGGTPAARERDERWLKERYHMPGDDLSQDLDWEAGAKFARFALALVQDVANADAAPRWKPGDFFGDTFAPRRAAADPAPHR